MLLLRRILTKQNVCITTRICHGETHGRTLESNINITSGCCFDSSVNLKANTGPTGTGSELSNASKEKSHSNELQSTVESTPPAIETHPTRIHCKSIRTKSESFTTQLHQASNSFNKLFSTAPFSTHIQLQTQPSMFNQYFGAIQSSPYVTCIDDPASLKPDPITGLTPKMVGLLKCLAAAIKPDMHTHGVNIFKRMFEMDRDIQRLFPKFPCDDMCGLDRNPDFNKHVDTVMKAILYNMEVSGSAPDLKSNMALQQKIHKDLAIPDRHFVTFGNAVNDYLKETLGVKYSEDVECAVAYFWKFLATEMTTKPGHTKCPQCGATIVKVAEAKQRK